jgi:hypothetical protein
MGKNLINVEFLHVQRFAAALTLFFTKSQCSVILPAPIWCGWLASAPLLGVIAIVGGKDSHYSMENLHISRQEVTIVFALACWVGFGLCMSFGVASSIYWLFFALSCGGFSVPFLVKFRQSQPSLPTFASPKLARQDTSIFHALLLHSFFVPIIYVLSISGVLDRNYSYGAITLFHLL